MIEFVIPGQPVGKGRPRIGKAGLHARMFTPAKTVNYESLVALAAQRAMIGLDRLEGAVSVTLDIVCQIPVSWSARKKKHAADGLVFPTTKPDIDNVEKAIFDGLNGVAWKDDVQVVWVAKGKRYGTTPRVVVTIRQIVAAYPGAQS